MDHLRLNILVAQFQFYFKWLGRSKVFAQSNKLTNHLVLVILSYGSGIKILKKPL